MTHAYFDGVCGVAGDMMLAALIDAGASEQAIRQGLAALDLPDLDFSVRSLVKQGIAAKHLTVADGQSNERGDELADAIRTWPKIHSLISGSAVPDQVKRDALAVFESLAQAEAEIHGLPIDQVHFHELAGLDSLVDIVGTALAFADLSIKSAGSGPIALGEGPITIAHGTVAVPAPATAALAQGIPVYGGDQKGELATPTGMALIRHFCTDFGPMPAMTPKASGYGAGTKDFDRPNVLRVTLGDLTDARTGGYEMDHVIEAQANIDDMTGEMLAGLPDLLIAAGALDAFITPVLMKKARPGHLVTFLATNAAFAPVADTLFKHTSSFGLRYQEKPRLKLARRFETVQTAYGAIKVKLGLRENEILTLSPEYADCQKAAAAHNISIETVYKSALAAASDLATVDGKAKA